tara:strand:- start:1088 stop:1723 length:636 start_codon:yes stop_codon:yes gene_type:complete
MYPTGWKLSSEVTAVTTAIESFQTELKGAEGMVIPCESSSMCLIGLGTSGVDTSAVLEVWGTQTNGETSQSIDFCINSLLVTATDTGTNSLGSMTVPGSAITAFAALESVTFAPSGAVDDNTSSAVPIPSIHWYNRLQGQQSVPAYLDSADTTGVLSGDLAIANKLWYFNGTGTDSGPAFLAVPCGAFNYLQCCFTTVSAGTVAVWSNLIR